MVLLKSPVSAIAIESTLFPCIILALAVPTVSIYSRHYIKRRIRHFERSDFPGAAEEAVRWRANLRPPSGRDWRSGMFMCRDINRRTLHLSYRLGW